MPRIAYYGFLEPRIKRTLGSSGEQGQLVLVGRLALVELAWNHHHHLGREQPRRRLSKSVYSDYIVVASSTYLRATVRRIDHFISKNWSKGV
jgi:hypothetical protein